MRINAFIAHHSARSRREADSLIQQGRIIINRKKAALGDSITQDDKVFLDGKLILPRPKEHYTCIVYHKPKGELVARHDERNRRTIYHSLGPKFHAFTPVGRLDFASEGLLILSDSKEIVSALMRSELEREYILKINKPINNDMIEAMEQGLHAPNARYGGHEKSSIVAMDFAPFCAWSIGKSGARFSRLKVSIKQGRNRELRRFFGYFGADVLDLRRVRYGFTRLNALPSGKWRYFNKDEYTKLRAWLRQSHSLSHT